MRSAGDWKVDEGSEERVLFPWLAAQRDPFLRLRVLDWIAVLGERPIGRGKEEWPGVFAARVPRTSLGVVWTLDWENRRVILAHIGSFE
jgi:hypothetical protein